MNQEQDIIKRVLTAQYNEDEANNLIRDYFPFIKSETAKAVGRIPIEGKDDELSIALMGFHEAIESYNQDKGAFLNFASLVIKRRIIDFLRHETKFKRDISLEQTVIDDEEGNLKNTTHKEDYIADREALKWEIKQLLKELERLGITISEVAGDCPKQEKVISSCKQVINYLIGEPEKMKALFETGKLPIKNIVECTSVKRKTLEKHRKYLIALTIIYFKEYDCLINHLTEVFKVQKGGK